MKRNTDLIRDYKIKIGGNIRKWRNLKGIKQKQLANALDLSEAAISNIENNLTDVTLSQLEDISMGLDVPVEQLFCDPQETYSNAAKQPLALPHAAPEADKELMNAVIHSMQRKDEQLQTIMQNVLHTMSVLMPSSPMVRRPPGKA